MDYSTQPYKNSYPMNNSVKLCECGCGQAAPIAERTNTFHGWVKGEPKRFINGHQRRTRKIVEILAELGATEELIRLLQCRLKSFGERFSQLGAALSNNPEIVYIDGCGSAATGDHILLFDSESLNAQEVSALTDQLRQARMNREDLQEQLKRC